MLGKARWRAGDTAVWRRAKEWLRQSGGGGAEEETVDDLRRLVREFAVHQVELERENEQLSLACLEMEEALARERAKLHEALQRRDEFLAVLSHELRNPLAPISSSLYLLSRVEPGSEPARRAQTIIARQVRHLARLVEDLLDVARLERGKVRLRLQRVDLADLVRQALDDFGSVADQVGLELVGQIGRGPFALEGDPARLLQVLGDLLGNAAKFTPRGGCIEVRLERESPVRAVVKVRDNGMGIEPTLLGRLFEPFAQGPQGLDRRRGGLGLGLSMVKGLVALHHGEVAIASEGPGFGTEVAVTLPVEPTREHEREERTGSPGRHAA